MGLLIPAPGGSDPMASVGEAQLEAPENGRHARESTTPRPLRTVAGFAVADRPHAATRCLDSSAHDSLPRDRFRTPLSETRPAHCCSNDPVGTHSGEPLTNVTSICVIGEE